MKALVYAGPKQVEVQEVKEPEKQDGKVKLNIRYCGVCGSDIGISGWPDRSIRAT